MTWLGWALFVFVATALVWWFLRTPERDGAPEDDPVASHYADRRRERAAALADWERDFRRARGLPEPVMATMTLRPGESLIPVRGPRMLGELRDRIAWINALPSMTELNAAPDVECTIPLPPLPAAARPTLY